MTAWEKKIIDALIDNYFASASDMEKEPCFLRLRSPVFFPNFNTAHPDEKESYLEAAESLEQKGIVKLNWEKRGKGERLKTLTCENFEKLFEAAGKPFPKTEAEKIRVMFGEKAAALQNSTEPVQVKTDQLKQVIGLLEFLSIHFSPREIGKGIDYHTAEEFIRLLEYCGKYSHAEKITTRALSVLLYRNSKHLEYVLGLCKPLVSRAEKYISIPDITFLERSYPEILISGKIFIRFKNQQDPVLNDDGHIFGFPLETVTKIDGIGFMQGDKKNTVLTVENKETFYALASPQSRGLPGSFFSQNSSQKHDNNFPQFTCYLYVGGYANRAADAMIKILTRSAFTFYHAGDLDPDGILILQHIRELARVPVTPLRMDAATFDQYRPWARTLTKSMLRQLEKVNAETRAVPELAGLLQRIEETGLGVEQEIVDYR